MERNLDGYVQSVQGLPAVRVMRVDDTTGQVGPWFEITSDVARDLVIYEQTLGHQVQIIAGEINKWHRIAAQAKRVWQVREREYRIWRDAYVLALTDPEGKPKEWKKPTVAQVEAEYRTEAGYVTYQEAIEAAEEAFTAIQGVVEGFRAKRDMLRTYVLSSRDGGAPSLNV